MSIKLKGKGGDYAPATGPFHVLVTLGAEAEAAAGQCAEHTFASADCVRNASGTTIRCMQP